MTHVQRPEPDEDRRSATTGGDHDSGVKATAARYPLWLIIGGFVIFALVVLFLAWIAVPAGP
jgi:hypothetical protein